MKYITNNINFNTERVSVRGGLCPPYKIHGGDFVHLCKFWQGGLCPGGILSGYRHVFITIFHIFYFVFICWSGEFFRTTNGYRRHHVLCLRYQGWQLAILTCTMIATVNCGLYCKSFTTLLQNILAQQKKPTDWWWMITLSLFFLKVQYWFARHTCLKYYKFSMILGRWLI